MKLFLSFLFIECEHGCSKVRYSDMEMAPSFVLC